ncbi:hypothetical protein G6F40_015718 [Rhizopus arrhizus]|nr:hypothetical protein G6F40_015718 [Rhizopus arrhizus]KAG1385569.1 hypothetical protein G6F59_017330 [Rhizopus arrhizus]
MKRNHEIRVAADGLVTIVGGKLTTSRHMAEQTIDAAQHVIGQRNPCQTKKAYLLGAAGYDPQAIVASGGMSAHLGERAADAHRPGLAVHRGRSPVRRAP